MNVGPNHVPYEDGSVRTNHVKNECASIGLHNSDNARPKQGPIERLQRSDNNSLTEGDVLWYTPDNEQRSISFIV